MSTILQRITRWASGLTLAIVCTFLVSTSVSDAQVSYPVTDWTGQVVPSAAGLYTVATECHSIGTLPVTVCTWVLRKLYGDQGGVVVVADYPQGHNPACNNGVTQMQASGYSRSFCAVNASAAVYGH